ncbi:MAG: hypothetical protein HOP00_10050 [Nitrospira sp.]|nr:hypothetical protein [Nitrospira sp.]
MTPSPHSFNSRTREVMLDLIWRQWSLLGVAGHGQKNANWIVDLEALVLITTAHGRSDPRLFDEMLDWLWGNAQWVNVQRLRNIRKRLPLGDEQVLRAIADWLSQRSTLSKWKVLLKGTSSPSYPEPLFRLRDGTEMSVREEPDPTFARHGLIRGPIERREMSQPPNPRTAAMLSWKLRSLFGVQARCEFLQWLLTHERGHPAEIARATYYFPRTVEDTLREFAASGLVHSAPSGKAINYWLQKEAWFFLRSWEEPRGFPRWIDWPRFFYLHQALLAVPTAQMSDLLFASELRRVFEELLPEIDAADLRKEFQAGPGDTGTEFAAALARDITRLHQGL